MTQALITKTQAEIVIEGSRAISPASLYLASLSAGSRPVVRSRLNRIAAILSGGRCDAQSLPWAELTYTHGAALRVALEKEGLSATTINAYLVAFRRVAKEAWRAGSMDTERHERIADLEGLEVDRLPAGRALSQGEIDALFRCCVSDDSPAGVRDAAILAVLYAGGLRVAELVKLRVQDYDSETGAVEIHQGKRNKERTTYLEAGARRYVDDWLALRGMAEGPLFVPVRKDGRLQWRRLTTQAVRGMLAKRAEQAAVAEFTPHDLRRSWASDLLDAGADIALVQRLAGHANPATTARYDRRPERAKAKAANMLHVPYLRGR